MQIRKPAVSGSFYPSEEQELRELIKKCFTGRLGPGRLPPPEYSTEGIVACVCPHAGYVYSGHVAAFSYLHVSSLKDADVAVIVGPNHYGIGSGVSVYAQGEWETPLGSVSIDESVALKILSRKVAIFDKESHKFEHSLEVQVPFLQYLFGKKIRIVPVCIAFQDKDTAEELGDAISDAIKGRNAVLIASSDLTHYEPEQIARKKDMQLLSHVEKLDIESFYRTLHTLDVTACGYGAIAAVMRAAGNLGFKKGEVLKYGTSADTTNDSSSVVGYASVRFV